ncbi:hypothetical protein CLPU_9c01110 [Gottschalkia purinilytica]|uniref:Uncharacterized protein n=1 Tax=Gottschalkia purinilytica TaxID=1503 RepID=A0A0L0WA88_GOTPU|nr:hypothetical protein [Gottschalkia purinilytica]KNF08215.1 hypothetical protein CLPU_9c01110 [Gottschalkia purinilytica]
MKKYRIIIALIINIIILSAFNIDIVKAEGTKKTLIVVLDELDFAKANKILNKSLSVSLLSTKTSTGYKTNDESFFTTISTGRRVTTGGKLFKEVKNEGNKLKVEGYKDVLKDLDKKYPNFSNTISFMGRTFKLKNKDISYIGNDEASFMACDKDGYIKYGENKITYNLEWLKDKTNSLFQKSDVLVVSYNINNNENRLKLLKEYIDENVSHNIMMFPKKVSGDMDYRLNTTLVPIIYKDQSNKVGKLTSDSTKRQGIVTNLDIFPTISGMYDIKVNAMIGNKISILPTKENTNLIDENKDNLAKFLNLNLIKYIFHGIIIALQIYVIFNYLFLKNKTLNQYMVIMNTILFFILGSLLLGIFNIHKSIVIYCTLIIISSLLLSYFLSKKGKETFEVLSVITNILILLGVFFNIEILYSSFIGYNNIVAAGRFYGLNNEIMGVLIITSVITYFWAKRKIQNNFLSVLFLLLYIPLIIFSLSGKYGANFGGYLTSISMFLVLIYVLIFNRKIRGKEILALGILGLLILGVNLYIDMNNVSGSHAGELITRIKVLGYYEFFDMIIKKLKQLLFMAIVPPWSVIFISQIFFFIRFFIREREIINTAKRVRPDIIKKCFVMIIVSLVAFIINDTGIVAFTYMSIYSISSLIILLRMKNELGGVN